MVTTPHKRLSHRQAQERHADGAGVFAVIGVVWGAYWALHRRHLETAGDAYVAGNVVVVTPRVDGTVVTMGADDTNASLAANVTLAQNALARAEADLERRRQLADSGAVSLEELNHA